MWKEILEHPVWDILGLILSIVVVCKLLHPDCRNPWDR